MSKQTKETFIRPWAVAKVQILHSLGCIFFPHKAESLVTYARDILILNQSWLVWKRQYLELVTDTTCLYTSPVQSFEEENKSTEYSST